MDVNGNGVIDRDDKWLLVSGSEYQVPQSGGDFPLTVDYNVDYEVTIESGCDWITVTKDQDTKAYLESATYTVAVAGNELFEQRRAGITFRSSESQPTTVYVNQDASEFSLPQTAYHLDNAEQTMEVQVISTSDKYNVLIPEDSKWISSIGREDGIWKFNIESNDSFGSDRTGTIQFYDVAENLLGEVRVYQTSSYIYIEQERFDLDNSAQEFTLRINSSTESYNVDVTMGSEWLSITSHEGTDWRFSVYLNSSYQPRNGRITVTDINGAVLDTIPVSQWCETVTMVNVSPGTLESQITKPGQLEYTETFIASGEMNEYDFLVLRSMPRLKNIDISALANTTLPINVFNKFYTLEKLALPSNLVETPYGMCLGCGNLKEALPLPESVKVIGAETFSGCRSLQGELVLHEGITRIGTGAFSECGNLTGDLVIPSTVTFIGDYSFAIELNRVFMKPLTPPAVETAYNIFPNYSYLGVPKGSKELYQAKDPYNRFMVIEEVDFDALGL